MLVCVVLRCHSLPPRSHSRRRVYLWLDRAEQSRRQQKELGEGCSAGSPPSCHTSTATVGGEGCTEIHSRWPVRDCVHKLTVLLALTRAHTHASTLLGHQRSSHRVILPRTESKDVLDSGSRSQRANKDQWEVCCLLTKRVQETSLSFSCFEGTAGFCIGTESVLHFFLRWSL